MLKGSIGKSGAGTCPVRGHSNVQGDRTMGIYEKPSTQFLNKLESVFNFSPPRKHGYDVVDAIHFWLKPIKSLTTQTIKKESLLTADLNEYINEQLNYLEKQIEYMHIHKISDEIFKNKLLATKNFTKVNYLYADNNNLLHTPNSVIGILGKVIHCNQYIIDEAIKNAQKN